MAETDKSSNEIKTLKKETEIFLCSLHTKEKEFHWNGIKEAEKGCRVKLNVSIS